MSPNWSGLDIPTRTVSHSTQMLPLRVHFEAGEPDCMRVRDSQIARAHRPPVGFKIFQPLEFPMGGTSGGRFSCVRLACILHQCCGTGAICTCDPTPWEGVGRRPNQTKRRFGAALKRGAKRLCFSPLGAWLHARRATCGLEFSKELGVLGDVARKKEKARNPTHYLFLCDPAALREAKRL